jgi:hypothetical protein
MFTTSLNSFHGFYSSPQSTSSRCLLLLPFRLTPSLLKIYFTIFFADNYTPRSSHVTIFSSSSIFHSFHVTLRPFVLACSISRYSLLTISLRVQATLQSESFHLLRFFISIHATLRPFVLACSISRYSLLTITLRVQATLQSESFHLLRFFISMHATLRPFVLACTSSIRNSFFSTPSPCHHSIHGYFYVPLPLRFRLFFSFHFALITFFGTVNHSAPTRHGLNPLLHIQRNTPLIPINPTFFFPFPKCLRLR